MPAVGLALCHCGPKAPHYDNIRSRRVVAACSLGDILCRVSGIMAPILAEVLYDKGPTWPLAVFCPSMLLVAIFSG